MKELTCYNCKHHWKHYEKSCPVTCPECNEIICPQCGGKIGKTTGDEIADKYTMGACHNCDWMCCGYCVVI